MNLLTDSLAKQRAAASAAMVLTLCSFTNDYVGILRFGQRKIYNV